MKVSSLLLTRCAPEMTVRTAKKKSDLCSGAPTSAVPVHLDYRSAPELDGDHGCLSSGMAVNGVDVDCELVPPARFASLNG